MPEEDSDNSSTIGARSDRLETGAFFASRFHISDSLGNGSMGKVYLASDLLKDNKKVALKILRSDLQNDPLYLARFLREVELTQKVTHPNVVRTFETGKFNNSYYFTMEHVEGLTLSQILKTGPCSVEQSTEILLQLCEGLVAIHKLGIIHRDLKSTNVMINNDGQVKIADFGIARLDVSNLTVAEELVGSATHMAPEIWKQSEVTKSSDLYSLGIILYELLTAKLPFEAQTAYTLMWKHLKEQPRNPIQLSPNTPQWLANLCLSLLSKQKSERPQSALEILEVINQQRKKILSSDRTISDNAEKNIAVNPGNNNSKPAPKINFQNYDEIWSIGNSPKKNSRKPALPSNQLEFSAFTRALPNKEAASLRTTKKQLYDIIKKNLIGSILLAALIASALLIANHYLLPSIIGQLLGDSFSGLILLNLSEVATIVGTLLIPFLFVASLLNGTGLGFISFFKLCFVSISVFFLIFAVNLLWASQSNAKIQIDELIHPSIVTLSEVLSFKTSINATPELGLNEESPSVDSETRVPQASIPFLHTILPLGYMNLILLLASALACQINLHGFSYAKPYYLLVPITMAYLSGWLFANYQSPQAFLKIETKSLSIPIDNFFLINAALIWGSMVICAIASADTKMRIKSGN